uniref:RAB29, member RAS onco family n=1 Tax=Scleropages formosus TaxID=113540 RepID=A0A8C9V3W9_SCLFO
MGSHDHLFKVLIVGDGHVGKTSLVHRYVEERFCKSYKSTVGVDFALKVLPWSNTETVRLQLWDIAGQERFTSMTRIYYKEASGCVLMFDVTDPSSFRNCHRWKEDLDSKVRLAGGSPVPCILLANKVKTPSRSGSRSCNFSRVCASAGPMFVLLLLSSGKVFEREKLLHCAFLEVRDSSTPLRVACKNRTSLLSQNRPYPAGV